MDRIERNYYLTQLIEKRDNGRVKVITGIRRCGKSVQVTRDWYLSHICGDIAMYQCIPHVNNIAPGNF